MKFCELKARYLEFSGSMAKPWQEGFDEQYAAATATWGMVGTVSSDSGQWTGKLRVEYAVEYAGLSL